MELLDIAAILLTLASLFAYVNHRWIKLPSTIGIMLISLVISLALLGLGAIWPPMDDYAEKFVSMIDFNEALMEGTIPEKMPFLTTPTFININIYKGCDKDWPVLRHNNVRNNFKIQQEFISFSPLPRPLSST